MEGNYSYFQRIRTEGGYSHHITRISDKQLSLMQGRNRTFMVEFTFPKNWLLLCSKGSLLQDFMIKITQ